MLGGQRIDPATNVPAERQIRNIVEEMAMASGVPGSASVSVEERVWHQRIGSRAPRAMIEIFCVSQGALDYLNRDELQGVVAHEFSHILNGDMRFNLRLIGILHGILLTRLAGKFMTLSAAGCMRRGGRRSPSLWSWSSTCRVQSSCWGLHCTELASAGLFVGALGFGQPCPGSGSTWRTHPRSNSRGIRRPYNGGP